MNNIYKAALNDENIIFNDVVLSQYTKEKYPKLYELLEVKNELLYLINVQMIYDINIKIKLKKINNLIDKYLDVYKLPKYIYFYNVNEQLYELYSNKEIAVNDLDSYQINNLPLLFEFNEYFLEMDNFLNREQFKLVK